MIVATPDLAGRLVGKRLTGRHFAGSGRIRLCDVLFGWGLGHELLGGFESVGWEHGYGDLVAEPDPASVRPLAWWPRTGLALADAVSPDGGAVAVAPRTILRRQLEYAVDLGFEPIMSSELEFTVFAETPASLHAKGYSGLQLHREHSHP